MRWYINDLSLRGQFPTAAEFVNAIANLDRARRRLLQFGPRLFCSRSFGERNATAALTCRAAVLNAASRDARGIILSWIDKFGPFLDDDRQPEEDDYFEFEGHDVTDQGLGEAARRNRVWDASGVFSFLNNEIDFEHTPLSVQHGLLEEPIGEIDVPNVWRVEDFETQVLDGISDPANWQGLIDTCRALFDRLLIPDDVLDRLAGETFYPTVAKKTIELFKVLQAVMEGRDDNGALTEAARELWLTHSQGDKAWFSDESATNKKRFKSDLTFADPDNPAEALFCPWHGKIKTPQFRIHFEWPVPVGQIRLKVVYIGPKITKA